MAKNMNELKEDIERQGFKWADALKIIGDKTGGKSVQEAMAEGWTIEEFESLLVYELNKPEEDEGNKETPENQPQSGPHSPVAHTEAPASLNTYYISPGGYRWQFTIRTGLEAQEMVTLLERAKAAEEWLSKKGYKPYVPWNNHASTSQQTGGNDQGDSDTKVCPIHHVVMRKREKHGEVWWSHKAVNPETHEEYWCKGMTK